MRRRFAFFGIVSTLAVGLAAYGCGGSGGGNSTSSGSAGNGNGGENSGSGGNGNGGEGGCVIHCSTGQGGGSTMAQLIISPQDPVLNVVDTTIATQVFTVKTKDGVDVTSSVQWLYDRPDIGDMTNDTFNPPGRVGGLGILRA